MSIEALLIEDPPLSGVHSQSSDWPTTNYYLKILSSELNFVSKNAETPGKTAVSVLVSAHLPYDLPVRLNGKTLATKGI